LFAITLLITYGYVERQTNNYLAEDARIQENTRLTRQKTRALEESMPAEGARRQVQLTVEHNRRVVAALAQFMEKGLRDDMPVGAWIEDFNLGENNKFNITGLASDPL